MRVSRQAFLALVLFTSPFAAHAVGGRDSTLDQDFQGPRVVWEGAIVGRIGDGQDTCFVLDRFDDPYSAERRGDGDFIACNPGRFDEQRFAPGQVLRVTGNLGAAVPRRIGQQVWEKSIIAGAILERISRPSYPGPGYYHGPFDDPFYSPFYGNFYGPGFQPFFYYGRGWR